MSSEIPGMLSRAYKPLPFLQLLKKEYSNAHSGLANLLLGKAMIILTLIANGFIA